MALDHVWNKFHSVLLIDAWFCLIGIHTHYEIFPAQRRNAHYEIFPAQRRNAHCEVFPAHGRYADYAHSLFSTAALQRVINENKAFCHVYFLKSKDPHILFKFQVTSFIVPAFTDYIWYTRRIQKTSLPSACMILSCNGECLITITWDWDPCPSTNIHHSTA